MKDSSTPPKTVIDPVNEARRYVQNAKDILIEKADLDEETQLYRDKKYVRMAGNTLWNGVLLILEAVFNVKNTKKQRVDYYDYQSMLAKRDRKLLNYFNNAYDLMHLSMGYDGNLYKANSQEGIRLANAIIDRCAQMLPTGQS